MTFLTCLFWVLFWFVLVLGGLVLGIFLFIAADVAANKDISIHTIGTIVISGICSIILSITLIVYYCNNNMHPWFGWFDKQPISAEKQ